MHRVLIIELSATLRHLVSNLLKEQRAEVQACSSYTDALNFLDFSKRKPKDYSVVVIGWPARTDSDADEIIALLSEPQNKYLNVIVLAHEVETAILDWVTHRDQTALVLWDDYRDCAETIKRFVVTGDLSSNRIDMVVREQAVPMRVLFVDDSPTVRVNFRRLLRRNGYETDTASCVREGFEKALEQHYDIAIIDYFLPDGTGDILCAKLRDNVQTARMTSAIITGTYHDKVIKDSLDAGAVECMFKNEADELFLARISTMSRMKRILSAIEKDHKRLEGILSSVGDGVYGVNTHGAITFINPAAKQILGFRPEEQLIGKLPYALFHSANGQGAVIPHEHCALSIAYGTGQQLIATETHFRHTDGNFITVECTVFPLTIDGVLEGSVVAFRDVTVRKLLEDELKWQATHDSLTNLSNRYYLEEQLRDEVARLRSTQQQSALLYLDLDRFKYINDTAGHAAGDKLLIEIGQKLSARLSAADTLARIGGDEFALILRDTTREKAYASANLFRRILENFAFCYDGKTYVINASIGLAMLDSETQSHGEALANADLACFIAKGKGRNNTHFFEVNTDEKALMDKDLGWSVRLKEALANDLFQLHYQPIVALNRIDIDTLPKQSGVLMRQLNNIPNTSMNHNEVLLRLPDSRGQLISPDAFLPTAERFNMMNDIDRWVIRHSIRMLAEINTQGKASILSINLSGQTLEDRSLAAYVGAITRSHGVDPSCLLFEITENSAISNLDAANRLIRDLRMLGCKFALDDFGRGFCSFSHLKFLPVDYIKIDGIFIQGVLYDPIDRAIVNSVVQIAHSVGKKTIAEYVENIDVIKLLKEMGVDYVQGYYISRPQDTLEEIHDPRAPASDWWEGNKVG